MQNETFLLKINLTKLEYNYLIKYINFEKLEEIENDNFKILKSKF